ncbi:hypothetical protein [Streptomyces sp. NPDC093109]|uniref:hypothetical protein n=1 Tax=Streptomyces sp. NPDC093109 TaxID=3154977 RepID=UPI00344F58C1
MRGDDAQRIAAGGDGTRVKKGPRHAAPRKSFLTKLQIPAGKAMALAAMPTAVFVGMGLTPRLAMADDKDIPFAPGPCVTRSDEPDASASSSPAPTTPAPTPSAASPSSPSPSASSTTDAPSPSASESESASDAEKDKAKEPAPSPSASAEPEPAVSSSNPLDPLGLGDVLSGLIGGGTEEEATSGAEPTDPEPTDPEPSALVPAGEKRKKATEDAEDSEDTKGTKDTKDAADSASDAAKDAIKDAADEAGATVEELDEDARGLDVRADDEIPAAAGGTSTTVGTSGKEPFPCPTADPAALAAAEEESGIPLLPDEPWQLDSTLLTLSGLDYHGIVEVRTGNGVVKKALKFTATSLDIKDLHQTAVYPMGMTAHVQARTGSTSTIRGGEVTMYTEELKGNLFGIIPVTFSPATPPPLNVPFAFFTDAHVVQAGQFGGTLTIPGLRNYLTG